MELAGTRIGPYQLAARIGAGGMGQVYEAQDTRLARRVAVKVLPADAAESAEARERFDREGRTIAGLNHPNICVLHDVGQSLIAAADGEQVVRYLVMELLDGETLAARLSRGRLPLADALRIGAAIAAALDRAHRAGVVHRDIKPANVMLTKTGVKVLDFGIAKAMPGGATDDLTRTGVVIGTLAYMSPEQLGGGPVDHRSDVYALGIVFIEMLTGARPQSPVVSLRSVPPAIERCVLKCVAADPDERWQTAADLKSELEWIARDSATPAARRSSFSAAPVGLAVATLLAIAAAATLGWPRSTPDPPPRYLSAELPGSIARLSDLALSPDGSNLAYIATEGTKKVLRVRNLRTGATLDLDSGPQRGSGLIPYFSPDGQWIVFANNGKVWKVRTTGGASIPICDALTIEGASWSADGMIVFSSGGQLWRVDAAGGTPQQLAGLQAGESAFDPQWLPGGVSLLATIVGPSGTIDDAWLESVSVRDGSRRKLVKGAGGVTVDGFLVFSRGSDLLAMPFDAKRAAVSGSPATVLRGVGVSGRFATAQFAIAHDGTLAFFPLLERGSTIVRVSKTGRAETLPLPPRRYAHLGLLPGEQGMVLEIEEAPHQLFRYDFASQALTRLTTDGANHRAVLSPDGRSMIFSSDRTVPRSLFRQPTDGSGVAAPLSAAAHLQNASAWSADGRWLVFTENRADTRSDVWVMSLSGERQPRPFANSRFQEQGGTISPDGRWIAYASDESGRLEIIMAAFPGPGPRTQVSTDGGDMPLFSADGRQLYFRLRDQILAVDVARGARLQTGRPRVAFDIPDAEETQALPFPVTSTGDAIYYARAVRENHSATVILNWFTELRKAVDPR